ncbi:hypothetical protein BESB_066720 [Besnoitia besnoiti]|uniref:Uncharacterized protein n=1 Tax=Besnoitia besnoiti TaxID=94643 RepID=A0A2A9M9Q7_BESBE|nr:hypothetical protein BESB_066720 [Besnoitia besnoiti]PFH34639.1 hypothetical protein BESB_066720 [Besnoitia besnoiti]
MISSIVLGADTSATGYLSAGLLTCVCLAVRCCVCGKGLARERPIEATVAEIRGILQEWDGDTAVFFYTSWDTSSRHLLGLWGQAARFFSAASPPEDEPRSSRLLDVWRRFVPPLGAVQLRRFDCEKSGDARKLCRSLRLPFLPAALFFSYGPLREEPDKLGRRPLFDEEADSSMPLRCARFKGDLFMYDALLDWIQMMRRVSYAQRVFSSKQEPRDQSCEAGASSPAEDELARCREQLKKLESENQTLRKDVRRLQGSTQLEAADEDDRRESS